MGRAIGDYVTILIIAIVIVICTQTTVINIQISKADTFKLNSIDKIEASYFNPDVISNCITEAASKGYSLTVENVTIYADRPIYKVTLVYNLKVNILGINEYPVTIGYAK